MSSGNLNPTSYTQHQRAPIANRGVQNPGNEASARRRRANPTNLTTPSTPAMPTTQSQKLYVLTYDAQDWYHPDTTDSITLLNGKQIPIGLGVDGDPASRQRSGLLGIYLSENAAEMMGHSWVYDQLRSVDRDFHMPLPRQDLSQCARVTWKHSGWVRSADGSWGYAVSDMFRRVQLVVLVTKSAVDGLDAGVGKEGQGENAAGEEKEGDGREIIDLTGDDGYVRVGNAGKRKRVAGEDVSGVAGEHMSETDREMVSLLLTMKGGRW